MLAFLQASCAGATLEELEPPQMTVTVPSGSANLSQLFGKLADAKDKYGVHECSVTQCTLEQIFLLMASKQKMRSASLSGDQALAELHA